MPYSAEHKQQSKHKLLESAYELFAHRGYEFVTIDMVAQHAGLTRGAFYNHFSSKQALYSEAMIHAAHNNKIMQLLETEPQDIDTLTNLICGYLNQRHLDNPRPGPLAFLVNDVANQKPQVRATYTHLFEDVRKKLARLLPDGGSAKQKREKSQALVALLIGGVAVSRSLNDDKLANQLMQACRSLAMSTVEQG